MSRCFPYPPAGYPRSRTQKSVLIESIELQKEKVKAEVPKKKEKKEKKKEKKLKRIQNPDKSDIVRSCIGENLLAHAKVKFSHKGGGTDSEQLERSSLTEEHKKPVCLLVPSSSSDSTENSNKRKRPSSPLDVGRGHGKIIRIRLTSKKQDLSNASANEQKLCFMSGTSDRLTSNNQVQYDASAIEQKLCSTSSGSIDRLTSKKQYQSDASANAQKLCFMSGATHRLTSKKQYQSDASANEQKLGSTSGTTHRPTSKKYDQSDVSTDEQKLCFTSGTTHWLTSKKFYQSDASANEQKICSTSGMTHRPTSKKHYQSDVSTDEQKLCLTSGTAHRLASKKRYQSDASANEQKLCSASGKTQSPSQPKDDSALRHGSNGFCRTSNVTSSIGQGLVLKVANEEQLCSTSNLIGTIAAGKTIMSSAANAIMTPMQREELLYKNLIENWVPPQRHDACFETEDQDWLIPAKKETIQPEKSRICRDDSMFCSSTSTLWPRAQHLPEVDVYALPYTLPF